jgi:hypothetical protein
MISALIILAALVVFFIGFAFIIGIKEMMIDFRGRSTTTEAEEKAFERKLMVRHLKAANK